MTTLTTNKCDWTGGEITVRINEGRGTWRQFDCTWKLEKVDDPYAGTFYNLMEKHPLLGWRHFGMVCEWSSTEFEAFDEGHSMSRCGETAYAAAVKLICNLM